MRKYFNITASAILALLLMASACGESEERTQDVSGSGTLVIQEKEPVTGWLEVVLPGIPVAMDGCGEQIWILTSSGVAMGWDTSTKGWSSIEAEQAFDIASDDQWIATLSPVGLTVLENGEMTEVPFGETEEPVSLCATAEGCAVLFRDGSVKMFDGEDLTMVLEPSGTEAAGRIHHENGVLAWKNESGTASVYDMGQGLLTEVALPEETETISLGDGTLLAVAGGETSAYRGEDLWEHYCDGTVSPGGLVCTQQGVKNSPRGEIITAGISSQPDRLVLLDDGTVWSMAENGIAVWGEIGSVETRLPEADVQLLSYRMSGQTGEGSAGGGVSSSDASLGGVFRIYESVSSRPDPFTEFPAASRDLRRPIEDLTIEELHLVGITIDPSGGDQAMVEDANGVAYVLREGTELSNNTRIAEITGNEVIVVQEVMVGSEDDLGGTTSIPTIFSMRLHEEGGL